MRISLLFAYSWRNMLARKLSTAITLLAVAAAALVFIVMSATAAGIRNVASNTGTRENVMVMSKGATSVEASVLDRATLYGLREVPSVLRNDRGERLMSVELLIQQAIPRKGGRRGDARFVSIRGVTPSVFAVHPGIR